MIAKVRITVPKPHADLLARSHLDRFADYPVVVLAAGAGFGKSQLLARWAELYPPVAFGLCSRLGETASSLLELLFAASGISERFAGDRPWQQQTDVLLEHLFEQPGGLFFLDDIHHLESATSDADACRLLLSYLLDYRPQHWRFVLSGRSVPELADLEVRRLKGELVVLTGQQLSLSWQELDALCPGQGGRLAELTSGWPLAAAVLMRYPGEQWEEQKGVLGESLLQIVTSELSPQAIEAVAVLGLMGWASQHEIAEPAVWSELQRLSTHGVLVQALDKERLGLHPLFAEQYRAEANDRVRQLAEEGLLASGRVWEALELTRSPETLRDRLLEHGEALLAAGRHHLLARLLERAAEHPALMRLRGEADWRLGEPAQAMAAFGRAARLAQEVGHRMWEAQAWSAAAQLYLDAVSPREAGGYLRRAYRALGPADPREKAKILERFAENAVNEGNARQAMRYRKLAARWDVERVDDWVVNARILLRSGRLSEARGSLEATLERGLLRQSDGVLESHRDPRLVLAYLHALEGRHQPAEQLAIEVLEQAREFGDRLTEAVALARLGHARLVRAKSGGESDDLLGLYAQAGTLAGALGVERLRAEMLMGQALYHSFKGDAPRAYEAAREGVDLARKSGDAWIQSWLELAQSAAACQGGHPAASELLMASREAFRRCRDRFGYAVCEAWMARRGQLDAAACRKVLEEFSFLAERASLFGPPPESLASCRQVASAHGQERRLQVFCLGTLSLLLDGEPVPAKAFKRKKARELLALLLAAPDRYVHREELASKLWPQAEQKASLRDFRVALHALSETLDPNRPKNSSAFCIDRQDERYCLVSATIELDSLRFAELADRAADLAGWERALKLYRGAFCEDFPYSESLAPVRQRFDRLYLETAEKAADAYLEGGRPAAAVEHAQRMLSRDATWEPAYRLLMRGQAALGHDHLLPRTFTLCLETLEEELGVEPSEETFSLARQLLGEQLATIL